MIKPKRRRIKPDWLKIKLTGGEKCADVKNIVKNHGLHTICTSGKCPNMGECWRAGTATFMILGDVCTRSCRFCAVKTGVPKAVDEKEAENLAHSIELMGLKHCVITSVDRDDLPDGGAKAWAKCIRTIKERVPTVTIETLVPDFGGDTDLMQIVINESPEVISHNLETVERLTPKIRSRAKYRRSIKMIKKISDSGLISKSGIMVGIGETDEEVLQTMRDLREVNCKVITIGQYLQPSHNHLPVNKYVTPEIFEMYKTEGLKMGFTHVESSPMVRSSYHAEKHVR